MKKRIALLLLIAVFCLTGCVTNLENKDNLATADILQVKIQNKKLITGDTDGHVFTQQEIENAKRVVLFGSVSIREAETSSEVLSVPAQKCTVRSAEIKQPIVDSFIIIDIPYEGLEIGTLYDLNMGGLSIALEGDEPVTEEDAQPLLFANSEFRPVHTPAPATPTPSPVPEVPQTGDGMNPALMAALACIGVISIMILARKKNEA